jgi:glycosyltransferase involved in cell wall biosynthesis
VGVDARRKDLGPIVPLVSVVIPSFNRSERLPHTVQSVLDQTCQDFEIVVVDDGSTDDTPRVLANLALQDRRVRHHRHGSNRGAQAARNTGITIARGSWIAFLDSDDRWLPLSLELRLRAAEQHAVKVVHSECDVIRADGVRKLFGVPPMSGQVYRELLRRPGPVFPALLIARETIAGIGFLDETIVSYQEWETAIRLARREAFAFVAESTFVYDCRGGDTISKDQLRDARGYSQVIAKHAVSIVLNAGLQVLAQHYHEAAERYLRAGRTSEAVRCERRRRALSCLRLSDVLHRIRGRRSR